MWIAARSSADASSAGASILRQAAVTFKPHVPRPVDHDLAHVRVCERRLSPRQKGFQEVQRVVSAHSRPVCLAVQYGRSTGR